MSKTTKKSKTAHRPGKHLIQAWVDVSVVKVLKSKEINMSALIRDTLEREAKRLTA